MLSAVPFFSDALSSAESGGSLPAHSAVPAASAAMPAPEPTGWKLTVMPELLSVEPHCW